MIGENADSCVGNISEYHAQSPIHPTKYNSNNSTVTFPTKKSQRPTMTTPTESQHPMQLLSMLNAQQSTLQTTPH